MCLAAIVNLGYERCFDGLESDESGGDMNETIRRAGRSLLLVAALTWPGFAVAQVEGSARTSAEALFAEGKSLMQQGNYEEACPKLAASYKLDPGVGALLNLGVCYEKIGRLASAWGVYREAIALGQQFGQAERVEYARAGVSKLEGQLGKLTVNVASKAEELKVSVDGIQHPREAWGVPLPVDAGEHVIEASAPGRKSFRASITSQDGGTALVDIPELTVDPTRATEANRSAGASTATTDDESGPGTQRIAAIALGGVGLVGLGVGGFFGLSAQSTYEDADCSANNVCSPSGLEQRETAEDKALVATVAGGVGIAALAGAAVLWFTAPSPKERAVSKIMVGPSSKELGLELSGRFW
jgi:hypothetical protein